MLQLISELPDGYRTVFNLYEIDGYPQSEIAEMLGCSNSTVRTQLFKAKKVLKEKIELIYKSAMENKNFEDSFYHFKRSFV